MNAAPTPTEAQILDALKKIPDPDRRQDIVALGMVQGLVVKDGHVMFSLEVDAKRGPHMEPLRKAAEKAVEALPGIEQHELRGEPCLRHGFAHHPRGRGMRDEAVQMSTASPHHVLVGERHGPAGTDPAGRSNECGDAAGEYPCALGSLLVVAEIQVARRVA